MEKDILRITQELTEEEIRQRSALQLAFIGDAVYELLVRRAVLERDLSAHKLHKRATDFVKAKAQKDAFRVILHTLNQEELYYFRRGRNSKIHSAPKNADIQDYKIATGLESLFGYLYLKGDTFRIYELFSYIYSELNKEGD